MVIASSDGDQVDGIIAENNGASNITLNGTNCKLTNFWSSGSTALHGLNFGHNGFSASGCIAAHGTVKNNAMSGIAIAGQTTTDITLDDIFVSGHTDSASAGVLNANVAATGVRISMSKMKLTGNRNGVNITSCNSCVMSGNKSWLNSVAGYVYTNAVNSTFDDMAWDNGQGALGAGSDGIYLTGASTLGNKVSGRYFDDQGASNTQLFGVHQDNGSGTLFTNFGATGNKTGSYSINAGNFIGAILDANNVMDPWLSVNGDTPMTANPRMMWPGWQTAALNNAGLVWATTVLDKAITVTRVTAIVSSPANTCTTTYGSFGVTDGTTPITINATNGTTSYDTGAISQNYAAGATLQIKTLGASSGCTGSMNGAFVTVQYKMQ